MDTHKKPRQLIFALIISATALVSCQKEIDGSLTGGGVINPPPPPQKPKLGTTWTYRYYTYHSYGGVNIIKQVVHRAKAEETLGGEKWLKIVDVETDTTVYYLNEKTGGLYQYANNNSNLFCKDTAILDDTYSSFFEGSAVTMTVKGMNNTLPTGIGDVPANYYEGKRGSSLIFDKIWYNKYAWIVRKYKYHQFPVTGVYYQKSALYIDNIVY